MHLLPFLFSSRPASPPPCRFSLEDTEEWIPSGCQRKSLFLLKWCGFVVWFFFLVFTFLWLFGWQGNSYFLVVHEQRGTRPTCARGTEWGDSSHEGDPWTRLRPKRPESGPHMRSPAVPVVLLLWFDVFWPEGPSLVSVCSIWDAHNESFHVGLPHSYGMSFRTLLRVLETPGTFPSTPVFGLDAWSS